MSALPFIAPAAAPRRTLRGHVEGVEEIADTIESLDNDDLTEEDRRQLAGRLIAELAATRAKVDATAATLALFESLEAAAKAECDRLAKRAAYYARQAKRLTDYVLATLEAAKLTRIEGETSTLARRLNPPSVVIDDPAQVPEDFLRYPPPAPAQPDKTAIKLALQAGDAVPGCTLTRTSKLVRS